MLQYHPSPKFVFTLAREAKFRPSLKWRVEPLRRARGRGPRLIAARRVR